MATQQNRRRNMLLAILLALIAAGTLCVWGAAAAGFTISSPILDAFIDAITVSDEERAAVEGGAGGGADGGGAMIPATGGDGGGVGSGDEGAGGGEAATGKNCLLGILCINADASANISGGDGGADVNGGAAGSAGTDSTCFLGLICLNAKVNSKNTDGVNSGFNAAVNADEDGLRIDADADADADAGTDNNCILGLICLNANVDASSNNGTEASLAGALGAWWDSFVSFFVNSEAQS